MTKLLDKYAPRNEEIIAKLMPKFAAIESARAKECWGVEAAAFQRSMKKKDQDYANPKNIGPISQEKAQRIVEMFKSGAGIIAITKAVGASDHGVYRALAAYEVRRFPESKMPKKCRTILRMMERGATLTQIGEEFGISRQAVSRYVHAYGLHLPEYKG
jgi:DNA invertase Pin-like site-specific DNA recombinase